MRSFLALILAILSFSADLPSAHARGYGEDGTLAEVRQDQAASRVKIRGTLQCSFDPENTSAPCTMKIHDGTSGRMFLLTNVEELMRLYHDGKKEVVIEGTGGGQTIEVKSVSAL